LLFVAPREQSMKAIVNKATILNASIFSAKYRRK
jgi:hypothetical protein